MRRILPLLAVLCLAFAPAPFPRPRNGPNDPRPDDLRRMQGTWVFAYNVQKGVQTRATSDSRWVIAGDTLTTIRDGEVASRCCLRLDTNTKPGSIDLRNNRNSRDFTAGRYSVTDDLLTISLGFEARPRDLSGRDECKGVWVFARKRK
jgi:uncharacterized protein (TIGR03067 family)